MSSKQAARERRASERAQRERGNDSASLCNFAGTAVTPNPRAAGMRTSVNASGRRQNVDCFTWQGSEAAT